MGRLLSDAGPDRLSASDLFAFVSRDAVTGLRLPENQILGLGRVARFVFARVFNLAHFAAHTGRVGELIRRRVRAVGARWARLIERPGVRVH